MTDYKNVESSPEKFGLQIVTRVSQPDMSWEFDEYIVWADTDGRLYYAQDAGCSCPTPFEDINSVADLQPLTWHNYDLFDREVTAWHTANAIETQRFLKAAVEALRDPLKTGAAVRDYLDVAKEANAKSERRAQFHSGLSTARAELRKVFPNMPTWDQSSLADKVEELQSVKTYDILVLGVYLTRMSEITIAENEAKQAGRPVSDNPQA